MTSPHITGLRCVVCRISYAPDEVGYVCPEHGNEGILDVEYDYAAIRSTTPPASIAEGGDASMWRYRPLLPIAADGSGGYRSTFVGSSPPAFDLVFQSAFVDPATPGGVGFTNAVLARFGR